MPNLHPGSIAAKRESRTADTLFVAPPKRDVADRVEPEVYDQASRRLELTALGPRDCKFPVNDAAIGEGHLFCGQPRAPDSSYCPHHHLRCTNAIVAAPPRQFRLLALRAS